VNTRYAPEESSPGAADYRVNPALDGRRVGVDLLRRRLDIEEASTKRLLKPLSEQFSVRVCSRARDAYIACE